MTDVFGQSPDIVGEIQAEKAYGPIYSAQYQDAMKSARANELGHRLGIPADIVESDIPNMMARDRLNRAVQQARQNRSYAQMMSNPRLAAAGIDDQHLPAVASAVDTHKNYLDFSGLRQRFGPVGGTLASIAGGAAVLGGRLVSGVSDLYSSASNFAHAITEIGDYNHLPAGNSLALGGLPLAMRLLGKEHNELAAAADATRYQTSNRTFNDIASGVESIPANIAALAATAEGGPVAGAGIFAGQAFGDSFEEGRKAGLNPNQSAMYGVGDAAIMGGSMFLPEKYLGGALAGKGGALKGVGSGVGLMQVATALQGLNHWYWLDRAKGVSFDQFLGGLPDQERSSFVSTITALGLTAGAGHIASRIAGHAVDAQASQHLENVMDAAAKSTTRTANPSDFEAALNQLVGDSNGSDIYVPADKVLDLFQPQEGKPQRDIRSDPFWSEYAPQVEEAAQLGGDVVLPLSKAATHLAGSSDWNALREFVRTRPGGASLSEIKSAQTPEELEALATQVAQKIDEKVPQLKAQALTKEFADQLGYKGEQADAISQLLGAGLARSHALENAKRAGRGEEPVPMEDFAASWLPQAEKTTQAAFDAQRAGTERVTAEAAQSFSDTQRRGNISIARDDEGLMTHSVIRAFEASDFSTGVHEIGHFFLEDLKRRALGPDASEAEKADWQAVKDWMGETSDAIAEPNHEQFARGFERYIYEGKAPSQGLKAVFAKMRNFMVSLYRSIRSFNSPITPEIRNVMDRLLASDDEIAARKEELRLGDQALHDLMSEEEQARYAALGDEAREEARDKLYDKVLSTIRAERTRKVAKRKAEIRQEIGDQVDQQPVFKALKLLRGGVPQEDGSTERATLPRQWLVDNYGEAILDKLPKGVPPIVDDAHGVDPEGLAHTAGFDSADQMVQKLLAHEDERQKMKAGGDTRPPRRAIIDGMTEERLRNELGDPYANLEEEADAALANEKQADRLSLELRALSRKVGGKPFSPWKVAKEWARAHVRGSTSRDAISGKAMQMYAKAATKAAQNVEEALAGRDYEAAFRAKQQQVLNLALMSEAKEAKDEVMVAVKRMRRVAKAKNIPTVDQDYLDQAHQLLEAVDMRALSNKAVDKRLAFEAWHAKQVAMEIEPVVPPDYRASLGQTHWSRLSINGLLDLDQAVKQIVKLGRFKQELRDGKRKRDYNEGVAEMQDVGGTVPPRKVRGGTTDPRKSRIGRTASRLRSIDAAMVKFEQLMIWMDNQDPNGPWQRMFYRPISDANGHEADLTRRYFGELNEHIKAMPKANLRSLTRKVDTPELVIRNKNHLENGQPFRGTKDQVLMMAMNWGNLGNRQRLLDGYGWDEQSVAKVFDRVLTKDDWDFAQKVWDTVDKLWPDVAKLQREVNGVEPEKIEAAEVPTPHGTYRGGYFPAVYDPMQSTHAAQVDEDKLAPSGGWWSLTTRSSATKERADQVKGRPLLLSLSVITHHMHEVIHDITHRQAVNQARKLFADDRVTSLINSRMGPEYLDASKKWLENVARPNAAYSRENAAVLWLSRYLNKAVTTVGLGFRVGVSLKQLMGVPFSGKELGAEHLAKGMAIVTAHPVKAYNEMMERSAEMRARSDAIDASIEDMREDLSKGKLKTVGPRGIMKYAFQGITYMDVVSRTTVWTSAYNKALGEKMGEDDAVSYADKAVRQSHGIGFQKDRAAIQYGHPFARAFWPFFSYMNALYNAQRDVGHRFARAETGSDYGEALRRSWWVFAVPALLQAVAFGEGPSDDSVEGWAKYLGDQLILGNLESLPIVGAASQALGKGYSYRAVSYQAIVEDIGKAFKSDKAILSGESDITGSAIKSTMNAAGALFAKPLGQIGATAGGLYDYSTGAADPHTVGDWYNLLTRGSIPEQPTAAEQVAGHH